MRTCKSCTLVTTSVCSVTAPMSRSMPVQRSSVAFAGGNAAQPQRTILELCETFSLADAGARLGAHSHRTNDDEVHADVGGVYANRLAVLGGACTRALSATGVRADPRSTHRQRSKPRAAPPVRVAGRVRTAS